jgi:membrane-associated phospholipid phosphatase
MDNSIFDKIGFFGPLILFSIGIYNLLDQKIYLVSYLVFFITNTLVNKILKTLIQQERPRNGKSIMDEQYKGTEIYGMPSGHAQSSFYSLSFLYFVKGSPEWLILELFIASLTVFQRWKYRQHTPEQLFTGSIVGIGFAYFSYWTTKHYLSGKTFYLNTI